MTATTLRDVTIAFNDDIAARHDAEGVRSAARVRLEPGSAPHVMLRTDAVMDDLRFALVAAKRAAAGDYSRLHSPSKAAAAVAADRTYVGDAAYYLDADAADGLKVVPCVTQGCEQFGMCHFVFNASDVRHVAASFVRDRFWFVEVAADPGKRWAVAIDMERDMFTPATAAQFATVLIKATDLAKRLNAAATA